MMNTVYGAALALIAVEVVNIFDESMPHDMAYYIDLMMPF